jgi:hypothetical protein
MGYEFFAQFTRAIMRRHTTLKGTLMNLKPSTLACIALGSMATSVVLSFAIVKGMEAYYGPEFKEACEMIKNPPKVH